MNCPLIVMTAVVGKPSADEIHEYMISLRDNGIYQALLYPRSGCEIEYLSDEWFCVIGHFISSAKSLGMSIWLYDDFNWPSGDAGGRVSAFKDFRLCAIATRGEKIGQISMKSRHNSGLFGEKYFPSLLSSDAVDYFINCTHEEYFRRFGDSFGTVIKGIFTDEPSIGYCCYDEYIPYYDGIREDYLALCGRDFDLDMRGQEKDFYHNAFSVISSRFQACYIDKIRKWCDSHGILMTGHFMCDCNPFWGASHSGNMLENLSHLSLPGIDEIETSFDDFNEMTLFGLAEYAGRKNGAMAELFALGPCDMTYQKRRLMIYLCACHKIDHYFLAISHLDIRGNALVKDFFSDFSISQPNLEGMKELGKAASHASLLAKKDFVPDVYVKYPLELTYRYITGGFDGNRFSEMINTLTYNQIQWKYTLNDSEDAPVIELDENFCFTIDKKPLDVSQIAHKVSVTDAYGNLPRGIFVRRFSDGEFIVLNLFAPADEYLINGERVFLREHDVYFSKSNDFRGECIEISPEFSVRYGNDNIARFMYLNGQGMANAVCDRDITVRLAVRDGVRALLNGDEIPLFSDTGMLPSGMRKLYRCSDKITLKKGLSTIQAENDLKYLPSVLLIGDFSYESVSGDICSIQIQKRANELSCGSRLYDYGTIELLADIEIPHGASQIEIEGAYLFTKVFINEIPLGSKAFSPFVYEIPSSLWGKRACLRIVQMSSLAPIFGDVEFWDKEIKECGWRKTPSTSNIPFGISKIFFKIQ